jgi:hypothetical protein
MEGVCRVTMKVVRNQETPSSVVDGERTLRLFEAMLGVISISARA